MNSPDEFTGFSHRQKHPRKLERQLAGCSGVETPCSLSLRGTSGERAGERGTFHRLGAANWNPLSLTLSPLLRRGERESTSAMVVWCQDARGVSPLNPPDRTSTRLNSSHTVISYADFCLKKKKISFTL